MWGAQPASRRGLVAESQGFEPWVLFRTQHFECCTFDHSDNSPGKLPSPKVGQGKP